MGEETKVSARRHVASRDALIIARAGWGPGEGQMAREFLDSLGVANIFIYDRSHFFMFSLPEALSQHRVEASA
jgi:hypothetical protein